MGVVKIVLPSMDSVRLCISQAIREDVDLNSLTTPEQMANLIAQRLSEEFVLIQELKR